MTRHRSAVTLLCCVACSVGGCVGYEADPADIASIAIEAHQRVGGTFTVDMAVDLALRQNPELRALEAQVRAAAAATTVPIPTQAQWRGPETASWMFDPFAILAIGPRGGAIAAAEAREAEAVATLATARWRTTAAVVEAFLVDAALAELTVPEVGLDAQAFAAAGLASAVAAARLEAAQARAVSERAELVRQRAQNLAALRHLLGLPREAELVCVPAARDYLRQPPATDAAVLARPDLALATAKFRTADADFRRAVADQYPTLLIGPDFSLLGKGIDTMAMLNWPLLVHGAANAARERRAGARATLEDAYIEAASEATSADTEFAAANATAAATATSLAAGTQALAAARAAVAVEIDAFARFAEAAQMALRDSMEHRLAVVAGARAAVRRATAFGWPLSLLGAESRQ